MKKGEKKSKIIIFIPNCCEIMKNKVFKMGGLRPKKHEKGGFVYFFCSDYQIDIIFFSFFSFLCI